MGERLAHFHRLEGLSGPRDRWRAGEDLAAARGLTLSETGCRALGVRADMMTQWFEGAEL